MFRFVWKISEKSSSQTVFFKADQLENEIRETWTSLTQSEHSLVYKDLPRLAPRVSIRHTTARLTRQGVELALPEEIKEKLLSEVKSGSFSIGPLHIEETIRDSPEARETVTTWSALSTTISVLVGILEDANIAAAISDALASTAKTLAGDGKDDFQAITEKLFTSCLLETRTCRALCMINQGLIFPCVYRLQTYLSEMGLGMAKDVRSEDGWQVLISVQAAFIEISHIRKEQIGLSTELFVVKWELVTKFNTEMTRVLAVWMKVDEVEFHPDASYEYRQDIGRKIFRGLIL